MGAAARTAAETIATTVVTTSGGEEKALARTPRTPASADPVTDLLRNLGGERRVIVPATTLAPSTLAETIDGAVTGVLEEKKIGLVFRIGISSPINRADTNSCTPSPKTTASRASCSTSLGPKQNCIRKIHALVRGLVPPEPERWPKSQILRVPRSKGLMKLPTIPFDIADGISELNFVVLTASFKEAVAQIRGLGEDFSEGDFWIPGWDVFNSVSQHYSAQVTQTKRMVHDAFARAEAEERIGQPRKQVLEGILRALRLGSSPSTPHQALQQLQTFEVPEKTPFADFLSELSIAMLNVKDVALVHPDDSTMQVAFKASIDDQLAILAASIFAGRNRSAIPFSSVEELLDSLGDLTMNRTPATAATRPGSRIPGLGAAAGSGRRGSVFTVVAKERKLKLFNRRCMALER